MSLSLKLGSLFIRTAAKPIGNYIKRQAREHEPFRRLCVGFAQRLHRIDMRLKLGLLQDPAVIERQIAREEREAADALAKKRAASPPTAMTAEEAKAAERAVQQQKHKIEEKVKEDDKKKKERRIRPLSEAKAIDSGANFISEAFLFLVAAGLIGFETWRSRNKEAGRKAVVEDRLEKLELRLEEVGGERDEERRLRGLVEEREKDLRRELRRLGVKVAEVAVEEKKEEDGKKDVVSKDGEEKKQDVKKVEQK